MICSIESRSSPVSSNGVSPLALRATVSGCSGVHSKRYVPIAVLASFSTMRHAFSMHTSCLLRKLQVRLDGEKMRREAAKAAELQRHALPLPQPSISRIRSHTNSHTPQGTPHT